MKAKYVAFDVETPNHFNNRICSIGVTVINEDGSVQTNEYLVNPECGFDEFNISLTGINSGTVEDAPSFPSVWKEIKPLFVSCVVVAHNALFDLSVLRKTLSAYNLTIPQFRYLCTMRVTQSVFPQIGNYKLKNLCEYYGISLCNHDSGSDSEACATIIKKIEESGIDLEKYIEVYEDNSPVKDDCGDYGYYIHAAPSKGTRALNEMKNILKLISEDGVLTESEILVLFNWINNNTYLKGNYPYDLIYKKLESVLEDGVVTPQEHDELLDLFSIIDDPVERTASHCDININGKLICLSGEFDFGSKDDVARFLSEEGAVIQNAITKKTNILLVGSKGSTAWVSENYGSKIKRALELQSKGIKIDIVKETELLK